MKAETASSSDYAIFQTGGKQYQAVVGKTLAVEKIEGEDGATISFDDVFFVKRGEDYLVGTPRVENTTVTAQIVKQSRGPKLIVFRFKRRKKYRVKRGHRQPQTVIRFTGIEQK
jgi:large subunit ribosomal protein L21